MFCTRPEVCIFQGKLDTYDHDFSPTYIMLSVVVFFLAIKNFGMFQNCEGL